MKKSIKKVAKITVAKSSAQHGDVVLSRIETLPKGESKVISKTNIILAGSASTGGHTHSISSAGSQLFEYKDGMQVLELKRQATLQHQEHQPITLEAGHWKIGAVQEYDYFAKLKRAVID